MSVGLMLTLRCWALVVLTLIAALHVVALPLDEAVLESVGLGPEFHTIFEREGFTSLEDIAGLEKDSFTGALLKEMGLNVRQRLNVLKLAKTLRVQQQAQQAEAFVLAPKADLVALVTSAIAEPVPPLFCRERIAAGLRRCCIFTADWILTVAHCSTSTNP